MLLENDTIVAIATASGVGAISIIRLSGPEAYSIALQITQRDNLHPRYTHLSKIYDFENILKTKKTISNEVFFIGQPMENLLGVSDYYSTLKKIIDLNPSMVYISHRRDSLQKLKYIKDVLGIRVLRLDEIVELFLIKSTSIPKKVISFYSTTLVTLKILFKEQIEINYVNKNKLLSNDLIDVFENFNIKNEL